MLQNPAGRVGPLFEKSDKDAITAAASPRGHEILIIDDEFLMRSLIEKYVRSTDFLKGTEPKVHQRESGWELLHQDLGHVRVAVIDILLPQVTGVDLIRDLRKRYPEMGIIAVTGMATEPMKRAILDLLPEQMLLQKPLRKEIFSQALSMAWNETLPPLPPSPLPIEDGTEDYWAATGADLRIATEVPVIRRRIGRRKSDAS